MELSIIIVSYNTKNLIDKLLATLPRNPSWEIIIVDNASSDGTVQMVRKKFPHVKLIVNQKNLGFAKANNLGIKESKSKYILILNSDTLIVDAYHHRYDALSSGIVLVGLTFGIVFRMEHVDSMLGIAIGIIIIYIALNFANVDAIIARNNITRYYGTGQIDMEYLKGLSYGAVPYMEKLVGDDDVGDEVLVYFEEKEGELEGQKHWQSFNISRYRALKIINKYPE